MHRAALVVSVALLSACAVAPENIAPYYVSDLSYQPYTCEQLGLEQTRLVTALETASAAQRVARNNDTAGVFFIGLPVSSLSGGNQAANVARLKGELETLQRVGIQKACALPAVAISRPKPPKKSQRICTNIQSEHCPTN